MDDTKKMVLGMVGLSALLVLIIPSNFDVGSNAPSSEETPAPVQPKTAAKAPQVPANVEEDEEEEEDGFSFGDPIANSDPTEDGKPLSFDDEDDTDLDDVNDNTRPSNTRIAKRKTEVRSSTRTIRQSSSPLPASGPPSGPVNAAVGSSYSSPLPAPTATPARAPAPRKTIGTGGAPINVPPPS